jgi:hypothetical protein
LILSKGSVFEYSVMAGWTPVGALVESETFTESESLTASDFPSAFGLLQAASAASTINEIKRFVLIPDILFKLKGFSVGFATIYIRGFNEFIQNNHCIFTVLP